MEQKTREASQRENIFTTETVLNIIAENYKGLYGTDKVSYKNNVTNVVLVCPNHGDFNLKLGGIRRGQKCTKCVQNKSYLSGYEIYPPNTKLIPLNNGDFTLVDEEDYEKLSVYTWSSNVYGYASNPTVGKMHRLLLNAPKNMLVDHINRLPYDNRKNNLRLTDVSGNGCNKVYSKGESVYKGVSTYAGGKWRARVSFRTKRFSLGLFNTEQEAAEAYDLGALEIQGEYCVLNFPNNKDKYLKIILEKMNN